MQLSLGSIIRESFRLVKKYFALFLLTAVFYTVFVYIYLGLAVYIPPILRFLLSGIVQNVIFYISNSLLILIILSFETKSVLSIPKIIQYLITRLIPLIVVWYLIQFITIIGLILFIIPGIIFSIAFSQAIYFVLIDGLGPIAALKSSWNLTKGKRRFLFDLIWQYTFILGIIYLPFYLLTLIPQIPKFIQMYIGAIGLSVFMIAGYVVWKNLKLHQNEVFQIKTSILVKIIAIIFTLIFAAVFGYIIIRIFIFKSQPPTPTALNMNPPVYNQSLPIGLISTPTVVQVQQVIDSVDKWVAFTNIRYQYAIKYPTDFEIKSIMSNVPANESSVVQIVEKNNARLIVIDTEGTKDSNESFSDFVNTQIKAESSVNNPLTVIKKSFINGRNVIVVSNDPSLSSWTIFSYVEKNKTSYVKISLGPFFEGPIQTSRELFLQMLNTFTFTD